MILRGFFDVLYFDEDIHQISFLSTPIFLRITKNVPFLNLDFHGLEQEQIHFLL